MSEVKSEVVGRSLENEAYREYLFADGTVYRIENPWTLFTRPGGTTHRVVDAVGIVHCVAFPGPDGKTVLRWKPKDPGNPVQF